MAPVGVGHMMLSNLKIPGISSDFLSKSNKSLRSLIGTFVVASYTLPVKKCLFLLPPGLVQDAAVRH